MGACNWFKMMSGNKRKKENTPNKLEDSVNSKDVVATYPGGNKSVFLVSSRKVVGRSMITKEFAATRIQTAFRAYKARKTLHYLKRKSIFQAFTNVDALTMQASTVLGRLHLWSKIQAEIGDRRLRKKQMKFEHRLKVESELHELQMKWFDGPETMEGNTAKMQHNEKATNKRERALAYAFSHQWRASSNRYFGQAYYDLSKESWGWKWREPWIAVYRQEDHVVVRPVVSPRGMLQKKVQH